MKYNQVIVVEGYHDEQKIKGIFPEIECIITNGSEISQETLNLIYKTSLIKEVVLFLDPDYPGKRITNRIIETNGNYKFAYINKEKALNKNNTKVGIEHATAEDIRFALSNLITMNNNNDNVKSLDLQIRGLINRKDSALLRKIICNKLNIPVANGKTFLKYLNMLSIEIERIDEIIHEFRS